MYENNNKKSSNCRLRTGGQHYGIFLVTQGYVTVMLIDINKERAYGEMLDMRDSIEYLNRNVKVKREPMQSAEIWISL